MYFGQIKLGLTTRERLVGVRVGGRWCQKCRPPYPDANTCRSAINPLTIHHGLALPPVGVLEVRPLPKSSFGRAMAARSSGIFPSTSARSHWLSSAAKDICRKGRMLPTSWHDAMAV